MCSVLHICPFRVFFRRILEIQRAVPAPFQGKKPPNPHLLGEASYFLKSGNKWRLVLPSLNGCQDWATPLVEIKCDKVFNLLIC